MVATCLNAHPPCTLRKRDRATAETSGLVPESRQKIWVIHVAAVGQSGDTERSRLLAANIAFVGALIKMGRRDEVHE